MQNLKHVGKIVSSGRKCIVAYRTLPGDAYSCLIVSTENLPDDMHNAIINLVEGPTGQDAYEFAEALDRTQFPDGSRMLPNLHASGRLIKVPTNQVEMIPAPGVSILLSELNQVIAEQRGVAVDELCVKPDTKKTTVTEVASSKEIPSSDNVSKTTSTSVNESETTVENFTSPESEAKYYRSQADKLSKQAAEFRRKAEELVPTKKAKEIA